MARSAVPEELTGAPFRGVDVVGKGLLTRRQLGGRAWLRLYPDVYVWNGLALDHRIRCIAACLFLDGRGAVSGLDAAALLGADATRRGAPIEATVPDPIRVRARRGLRVVRSRLPAHDLQGQGHLLTTTPQRTAFDLARRGDPYLTIPGIDAMLNIRLVTKEQAAALARERKGWRGRSRVRAVLTLCDGRAESPQESRLRLILAVGRLPPPEVQFVVRDRGRFVARLDLAYPEHRLGVEYDGDHHRDRAVFRNDLRRLNDLRTCGWAVLRFVAADLHHPEKIISSVQATLKYGSAACSL